MAWTCGAVEFFSVSFTITGLQGQFNRSAQDIVSYTSLTTHYISLISLHEPDNFHHPHIIVSHPRCCKYSPAFLSTSTYAFCPSPSQVIFGLLSDRFGRKWPLIANLLLLTVLTLCTGFVQTFQHFLGIRSLFGIAMGGICGLASVTALEDILVELRGLASGILQQGYAGGYIVAAIIDLGFLQHTTWRGLFWVTSGLSSSIAVLRYLLPESELFLRARREREAGLNEDKPPNQRRASSPMRSARCSSITGCCASTL